MALSEVASLPPLTYLSFDPVCEGVGASQVLPYVERLARRGVDVTLHSFEQTVSAGATERLASAGVSWKPHSFGAPGGRGGLARMARAAAAIRGASLVHARSHLGGAAAQLARVHASVWDFRSFWIDQRIDLGMIRRGSVAERALRWMERRVACSSAAVVTLSAAAVPALSALTGCDMVHKARVISTCVDLDHFRATPAPDTQRVRLLMSGSLNALYDVPRMLEFHRRLSGLRPSELTWAAPRDSPWLTTLEAAGVTPHERAFADMPAEVAQAHAGLCLLRGAPLSAVGAAPTKLAEFLACGRPVVVSRGLGDFDELLAESRCGVVVDDGDDVAGAARQLCDLLEDPHVGARCRQLAERHFDVETGVDRLVEVYAHAVASAR